MKKRAVVALLQSSLFGIALTSYILFVPGHPNRMQSISSAIKVPLLLVLGCLGAYGVTFIAARIFAPAMDHYLLRRSAFACFAKTAVYLAVCIPIIVGLSLLKNYSVLLFASYGAFALAGVIGSIAFYRTLKSGAAEVARPIIMISLCWCCSFGLINAQLGWSMRPFVGWTGQPFAWYRTDRTSLWHQLTCETRNMRLGGISFPSAGDASPTKQWPC